MADHISYIGLDVHKESIVVAVASGGLRGEVREYGRIANTATALDRVLRKFGGDGVALRFCYEAGPCGYGIQRRLSAQGHECIVVAPSLIPKRAGDRVKTDRRDAAGLATLHRAGELTAVWGPDAGHEAMRDLVRARLDAVRSAERARSARGSCCARGPLWPAGPDAAASPLACRSQIRAAGAPPRARRLHSGYRSCPNPSRPVDGADRGDADGLDARAGCGGAADDARHSICQCGDAGRRTWRPLALYQSTPSHGLSRAGAIRVFERCQRQTGLTKAGNSAVRRLLIEAACCYRFPARISRELLLRQERQPKPIR